MTDDEIKQELEICEKATPEPWTWDMSDVDFVWSLHRDYNHLPNDTILTCADADFVSDAKPNRAFIAHARTNYPLALRELLRLRDAAQALVKVVHREGHYDMLRIVVDEILAVEAALKGEAPCESR